MLAPDSQAVMKMKYVSKYKFATATGNHYINVRLSDQMFTN